MKTKLSENYKLCYVDGVFAYFTLKELDKQWGDDWNDTPYEHNAGDPYNDNESQIIKIAFEADLDNPTSGHYNSPYSVESINAGAIAWLRSPSYSKEKVYIKAGETIDSFVKKIKSINGEVYYPSEIYEI